MPEHQKIVQSASPVARSGGGDISEKELSRERCNLFSTPTTRVQRAHPKKQLFSVPVNKFTAKSITPSRNLSRIRSCLDEYRKSPVKPTKIAEKAVSMEDLTPAKRIKRECKEINLSIIKSPVLRSADEEQAAATIAKFMIVAAWRKRREEIRCLRKTLEFQVITPFSACEYDDSDYDKDNTEMNESQASSSERLRIQVCTLKSLLDSDNVKVRLAIRELERLKQLLRDRDMEKAVLEREKQALMQDICDAEDRAAEINIEWRNCRNELESARTEVALAQQELCSERAAAADARAQRDHAYHRLSLLEDDLAHHEAMLASAEEEVAALKTEVKDKQTAIEHLNGNLNVEIETRTKWSREYAVLQSKLSRVRCERESLASLVAELRERLTHTQIELADTRRRLLWPRPVIRLLGAARSWLRQPMALTEAVLWVLIPSRHGC